MAVDQSKILFDSSLEIDKILKTGVIGVGPGTTEVYVLPDGNWWPNFQIMFSPGEDHWHNIGIYEWYGNIYGTHAWFEAGRIYFSSDLGGVIRYYIWSDKVNY